ncbi:hypothetical protein [Nocardioides sp. SYSU DS0663]|uniref:hypothetical protein n=1 Tax=Nocardioides sp. SYSU DS0663 TaxID=3416445 RepID=UPI003F4C52C2
MDVQRLLLLLTSLLLVLTGPPALATAESEPAEVQLVLEVTSGETDDALGARLEATRNGAPASGLTVSFERSGPEEESDRAMATTDSSGVASWSFMVAGEGPFEVTATVTDPAGNRVGAAGPVEARAYPPTSCRCTPISPWLKGVAAANGDDRLVVWYQPGGIARLIRRDDTGRREWVRRGPLDANGRRSFRVRDHNDRRPTTYQVVVVRPDGVRTLTRRVTVR